MAAHRHVQKFLSAFDSKNQTQRRVLQMLIDTAVMNGEYSELESLIPEDFKIDRKKAAGDTTTVQQIDEAHCTFGDASLLADYKPDADQEDLWAAPHPGESTMFPSKRIRTDANESRHTTEDKAARASFGLGIPGLDDGDTGISDASEELARKEAPREGSAGKAAAAGESTKKEGARNEPRSISKDDPLSQYVYTPTEPVDYGILSTDRTPGYLLYPLQCKLCGMRYKEEMAAEFGVHIEDHRRKTRALDEKTEHHRELFNVKERKVNPKLIFDMNSKAEVIKWSKESPNCAICGDKIRKVWDDNEEEWVLSDASQIRPSEFAHRSCVL